MDLKTKSDAFQIGMAYFYAMNVASTWPVSASVKNFFDQTFLDGCTTLIAYEIKKPIRKGEEWTSNRI